MARPKGSIAHMYTDEQIDWLKWHRPKLQMTELTQQFNAKFNIVIKPKALVAVCKRKGFSAESSGYFEKNRLPWNKGITGRRVSIATEFKSGNRPSNARPIGAERINTFSYVEIKHSEPNRWRSKHALIYEQHHGAIPNNSVVMFADSNRENFALDNLVLVTRAELVRLNKNHYSLEHPSLKPSVLALTQLECRIKANSD